MKSIICSILLLICSTALSENSCHPMVLTELDAAIDDTISSGALALSEAEHIELAMQLYYEWGLIIRPGNGDVDVPLWLTEIWSVLSIRLGRDVMAKKHLDNLLIMANTLKTICVEVGNGA